MTKKNTFYSKCPKCGTVHHIAWPYCPECEVESALETEIFNLQKQLEAKRETLEIVKERKTAQKPTSQKVETP